MTSLIQSSVVERIDNARQKRGGQGGAGRRVLRFAAVAGLVVAWVALERKRRLEEDAARTSLPNPPRVPAPTVAVSSRTRRRNGRRSLTTRVASAVVFALVGVVFALTGALEGHASELTTTHSFAAVADAYINSMEPDANFGRESVLRIDGTNPNSSSRLADSYVRFDVEGLSGPVVSAVVRFHGTKGDNTGFELRRVADSWSEESITWSNAPTSDSEVIASSGGFDTGAWTTLDVTSVVRDSGSVNLALSSTSPAPMAVASREAEASAPELVVTTTAIVPANQAPPSISGTAQQGATLTAALGTWTGAAAMSYSYEWRRCDQGGDDCASIGAGGETHGLTASDVGSTVRVAVTASNAAGQSTAMSAPTAVVTPAATRSPGDSEPPSAPGNPTVTASTPTAVVLVWDASSDNVGVVGYVVYQDGTLVQSTAGPTATIEGLVCGNTYEFSVDAVDAAGNRSQRTPAWVQTAACSDSEPPTAPTNLTLIAKTASSLSISWLPSSDNVGVTGYHVFLGGVSLFTVTQPGATLQTLTCGTTYTVGVQASDAAGNRSQIVTISTATETCPQPPEPGPGDTTPPTQPGNILFSASTGTSVSLTWAASTDDVAVSGYGLYVDGDPVSSATQPAATIFGLACGTAYTLAVDAYDAAGNHSTPAEVTAATAACVDALAPSVPANVQASSRTATSISLSWSPSSDNVGVTGYGLYRGGTQVGTAATTTGIFSGLACNTNYTLAVDAYDATGNRSQKTTVMVATTACPDTTPPSNTSPPTITGTAQQGETLSATPGSFSGTTPLAYAYQWKRCDSAGANCVNIGNLWPFPYYELGAADVGKTIRCAVIATNASGDSAAAESAATGVVAPLPAPSPPDSNLLIHSGFEVASTLDALPGSPPQNGFMYLHGIDSTTGFNWDTTRFYGEPWGVTIAGIPSGLPGTTSDIVEARIETVTAPYGTSTKALRMGVVQQPAYAQVFIDSNFLQDTPVVDYYARYWARLDPNLAATAAAAGSSGYWRSFWAFKTPSDLRMKIEIMNWKAGGPSWVATMDNLGHSAAPPPTEYWRQDSDQIKVPLDQWFYVEIYLHRSTGSDGRFYFGVNGQQVFNRMGPNYGNLNEPIKILAHNIAYGPPNSFPGWQWVDDFEVRNLPPCAGVPCGPPPRLS